MLKPFSGLSDVFGVEVTPKHFSFKAKVYSKDRFQPALSTLLSFWQKNTRPRIHH